MSICSHLERLAISNQKKSNYLISAVSFLPLLVSISGKARTRSLLSLWYTQVELQRIEAGRNMLVTPQRGAAWSRYALSRCRKATVSEDFHKRCMTSPGCLSDLTMQASTRDKAQERCSWTRTRQRCYVALQSP